MEQVKIHTSENLYFNKKNRMLHVQCWKNVKVYLKCHNLISVISLVFHFDDFNYGKRTATNVF